MITSGTALYELSGSLGGNAIRPVDKDRFLLTMQLLQRDNYRGIFGVSCEALVGDILSETTAHQSVGNEKRSSKLVYIGV